MTPAILSLSLLCFACSRDAAVASRSAPAASSADAPEAVATAASKPKSCDTAVRAADNADVTLVNDLTRTAGELGPTATAAHEHALELLDECLSTDSLDAFAFLRRANVHESLGDDEKAILDYTSSIRLAPLPEVISARGAAYVRLKQFENAWRDQRRLKAMGSKFAESLEGEILDAQEAL